MKASELIELLAELKAKHGDLEVGFRGVLGPEFVEDAGINEVWTGSEHIELNFIPERYMQQPYNTQKDLDAIMDRIE